MEVEMKIGASDKILVNPIKQNKGNDEDSIASMKVDKAEIENLKIVNQPQSERECLDAKPPALSAEKNLTPEGDNLELLWKDLTITATITEGKCKNKKVTEKNILDNVSGRVKSGECLAILGSSGAGKTTLLNYLSRKIESSTLSVTGSVTLNSENVSTDDFSVLSSYVMQDDILEASMTPKEILVFTAKMKFNLPLEQIEQKVFDMISDLNLKKCQNTRVGDKLTRGISGGERKRTSIGVELISDTKIIFLDEPTTGLDSYNAFELVQLLKTLANKNRMILFTIHQPSSEIYGLLSKINILALGKTVYFGPQKNCFDYFNYAGIPVPLNYNPFEHFMEVTNVTTVEEPKILKQFPQLTEIADIQVRYQSYVSVINKAYEKVKNEYDDFTPSISGFSAETKHSLELKKQTNGFLYQFVMLMGRNLLVAMRKPLVLFVKIAQAIVTATLVSLLYRNISKDYSGIQDRFGVILNALVFTTLGSATQTLLVLADDNKIFLRERSNKLYYVTSYFLAKIFTEMPVFFTSNILFGMITYFSVELNDTYSHKYFAYRKFILTLVGVLVYNSLTGASFAYMIGALTTDQQALIQLNSATTIPLLLLSGFFANAANFAPYLIPFEYISPFKYGFQVLTHIEFNSLSPFNCQNLAPDLCTPTATRLTFLEPFYVSITMIGVLIVLFKSIAFMIIYFFAKIKV